MHLSQSHMATLGLSAAKFLSCPPFTNYNLTSSSLSEIRGTSNVSSTLFCYYTEGHTCGYNAESGKILTGATGGCPTGLLNSKSDCYTTCALDKNSTTTLTEVTIASNGQTACSVGAIDTAQCIFNTTSGDFLETRYASSNTSTICKDVHVERGMCAL